MLKIRYINPKYSDALQKAGVIAEDAILNWNLGEKVVGKDKSDMFKCEIEGIGCVYAKRHFPMRNEPLELFRQSDAVREYNGSKVMSNLGITQAEPVFAATIRGKCGNIKCGVYIMREILNATAFDTILEKMKQEPNQQLLDEIMRQVFAILDKLHGAKRCHWDFKPRNLLISQSDNRLEVVPIDCRSLRRIFFFNRKHAISRDFRFLNREPLLRNFF